MTDISCKVLVLGGGPGGYIAGIRAGQLGLDTVLVEAEKLGGCCLNVGCIPSKAVIHAAEEFHKAALYAEGASPIGVSVTKPKIDFAKTRDWKDGIVKRLNTGVAGLLKKSKVRVVEGWGTMRDGKTCIVKTKTGEVKIIAEHVILATGSHSAELPFLPFSDKVISSTGALALSEIPKQLAVIGGGYIGLELGTAFAKLGSQVTVIEATPSILPQYDKKLTRPVMERLEKLGIDVRVSTLAKGLSKAGDLQVEEGDKVSTVKADKILVTVGRVPATQNWGLEGLDLTMAGRFIKIDERCHTSMRNVWAIGDVTGEPMLAHRAMAQGEMVAEIIAGERRQWDKRAMPAVCFTDPELVQVGLSEAEAKAAGIETITGQFPFMANGRAMTMEDESGFVRVIARKDNHLVLGIEAVGAAVSELSAEFSLAIEMGACLEDIAETVHAHPTKSEAMQEAALKGLGHALHI
jgi:dihydrolipoyl dehydrogenase